MVVPTPDRAEQVAAAVGAGAGRMISGLLAEGMSVGVGWGDTLMQTLGALEGRPIPSLSVVSLLGGVSRAKRSNPSEFAWRFASLFDGDCALVAAPAIVDSAETRRVLIERCGVGEVFARASALDLAVVSVATPAADATSFRFGFFSEAERAELVERGAVGDVLFHFFDRHGQTIDHPVHDRIISAPLAAITGARQRLLISGGLGKLAAIRGAIALLSPTLLVTDEAVAAALLGRPAAPQRG
jgi:DNA-binding transcriptional regulator LsrR (DeoR family)